MTQRLQKHLFHWHTSEKGFESLPSVRVSTPEYSALRVLKLQNLGAKPSICVLWARDAFVPQISLCLNEWINEWKLLSRVRLFETPWTTESMEFSRPEYRSAQPLPSPGESSQPRDRTKVFLHCRWILYQLSHEGSLTLDSNCWHKQNVEHLNEEFIKL